MLFSSGALKNTLYPRYSIKTRKKVKTEVLTAGLGVRPCRFVDHERAVKSRSYSIDGVIINW
jgi:hypothetical protein